MALATEALPDLGTMRHLSDTTLNLCNVRAVGADHVYGVGWVWDTYTLEGVKATRWKSVSSTRPPNDDRWAKYRWLPKLPDGNASYFDPDHALRAAVKDAFGTLFLVGGEIAAMSMFDAGYRNTTCFFGDNSVPDGTLYNDLKRLGVSVLVMLPDRDKSGHDCAVKVRDLLAHDLDFVFDCKALPYDVTEKHGKDVNDWWVDLKADRAVFRERLADLPSWHLREPEPKIINLFPVEHSGELPPRFVEAVLRDVESRATPNKAFRWGSDGWSSNFRCPFHDDREASAGFNRESMSFKCFACDKKSAKEYGEGVGISLKDYYDDPIPLSPQKPHVNGDVREEPAPTITMKPQLRPKLPTFAELSVEQQREAASGRVWLDKYLNWAVESSPLTPRLFHEAMGLWLLATASTRRVCIRIGGETIFPNLYVLIVGRTTIYRKSTAMNLAKSILQKANLAPILLPADMTPEALFDELAGVKPNNFEHLAPDAQERWRLSRKIAGQRSFFKDEVSSFFANMRKDYMQGFEEFWTQGYDAAPGNWDRRLKSSGVISIKDPCLSFLGATTPGMYGKYVGTEFYESGLLPRFAIITPEGREAYRNPADEIPNPDWIVERLVRFFRYTLPWESHATDEVVTPPHIYLSVDPEALAQLLKYREAVGDWFARQEVITDIQSAFYSRLATMCLKVATLLAGISAESTPFRIEACHAYAAQLICEDWRESLHRLELDVNHVKNGESDDNKVLALIRQAGVKGISLRQIMHDCNLRPSAKAMDALTVLANDGLIEKYNYKPEGRGRPTDHFRLSGLSEP